MGSLCWIGSTCPLGKLKPECGCEGWIKGRRHTLRTSKTVRDRIVHLVQDLAERHGLLTQPRGLLDSGAELEALGGLRREGVHSVHRPAARCSEGEVS